LFRCPGDTSDKDRIALAGDAPHGIYPYSYTVTSIIDPNNKNQGISSAIGGGSSQWFKMSSVAGPASKIMFAEEQSSLARNTESPLGIGSIVNDGRWAPSDNANGGDFLTIRHNKRGSIGWADGHVTAEKWTIGTNKLHTWAGFSQ
jgi:prepilin-type processing-associated H-X9-DG protein